MRPNDNPFEHSDPFFHWLYVRCGRSDLLTSLIILALGGLLLLGSIVFMGLLLRVIDP